MGSITRIDYRLIDEAQRFYAERGWQYIDVPWIVDQESVFFTVPDNSRVHSLDEYWGNAALVGSAEQSFIQLMENSIDDPKNWFSGKYQTVTPCFRDEKEHNDFTRPYFMKLELFDNTDILGLSKMVEEANQFLSRYIDTKIVKTDTGYDIIDSEMGIELGSYGIRTIKRYGRYLYGTGLAEPRYSAIYAERIARNNAYENGIRERELAQLAALKAKYE